MIRYAYLFFFAVTVLVFIAAPVLAIPWENRLFPGFLVEQSSVVTDLNGAGWSGRSLGISHPQKITHVNGIAVPFPEDLYAQLEKKKITSIGYEQIQLPDGSLPVLRPLSMIGGAMAAQIASRLLQKNWGGKGILMGGLPGVPPAEVLVIGAGIVGTYATQMFLGMGAHVTVIDQNIDALQSLWDRHPCIVTMTSTKRNIERATSFADVVVGAVLIPGQRAPVVVTREMVRGMKPRSVIIDVSIDEGGCVETSRPTKHEHPVYIEEGVLHYCVPNMPGAVARTATYAFVNAAMPYIEKIANLGVENAIDADPAILRAVNTHNGQLSHLTLLRERGRHGCSVA